MLREDDPSRAKDRVLVVAVLGPRTTHRSSGSGSGKRGEGGALSEGERERERERERSEERAERRREDDEWESCMLWVLQKLQERDSLHLLHVIPCCGSAQCSESCERAQKSRLRRIERRKAWLAQTLRSMGGFHATIFILTCTKAVPPSAVRDTVREQAERLRATRVISCAEPRISEHPRIPEKPGIPEQPRIPEKPGIPEQPRIQEQAKDPEYAEGDQQQEEIMRGQPFAPLQAQPSQDEVCQEQAYPEQASSEQPYQEQACQETEEHSEAVQICEREDKGERGGNGSTECGEGARLFGSEGEASTGAGAHAQRRKSILRKAQRRRGDRNSDRKSDRNRNRDRERGEGGDEQRHEGMGPRHSQAAAGMDVEEGQVPLTSFREESDSGCIGLLEYPGTVTAQIVGTATAPEEGRTSGVPSTAIVPSSWGAPTELRGGEAEGGEGAAGRKGQNKDEAAVGGEGIAPEAAPVTAAEAAPSWTASAGAPSWTASAGAPSWTASAGAPSGAAGREGEGQGEEAGMVTCELLALERSSAVTPRQRRKATRDAEPSPGSLVSIPSAGAKAPPIEPTAESGLTTLNPNPEGPPMELTVPDHDPPLALGSTVSPTWALWARHRDLVTSHSGTSDSGTPGVLSEEEGKLQAQTGHVAAQPDHVAEQTVLVAAQSDSLEAPTDAVEAVKAVTDAPEEQQGEGGGASTALDGVLQEVSGTPAVPLQGAGLPGEERHGADKHWELLQRQYRRWGIPERVPKEGPPRKDFKHMAAATPWAGREMRGRGYRGVGSYCSASSGDSDEENRFHGQGESGTAMGFPAAHPNVSLHWVNTMTRILRSHEE